MRLYQSSNGAILDLDHVLAVGPVKCDYSFAQPCGFFLTLAFGSSMRIDFYEQQEAEAERERLIEIWSKNENL